MQILKSIYRFLLPARPQLAHEQNTLIPWKQDHSNEPLRRGKYSDRYDVQVESGVLKRIRDKELTTPAPFGNQTLIHMCHLDLFKLPPNFDNDGAGLSKGDPLKKYVDIPINRIAGISTGNLENYNPGMTFREVLFKCLHGAHFTEDSINFLCGGSPKDLTMPYELCMNKNYDPRHPKLGIGFAKHGDWYIAEQGQQRVIVAMFAIFQTYGAQGVLRNVPVD